MRRWAIGAGVAFVVVAVAYWFLVRDSPVAPTVEASRPVATIGSGDSAVAVGEDGRVLAWVPISEETLLPALPLSAPPESGKLAGPVLQQARVLGAAPAGLRPYLESSYYGESGVDVMLRSGIELRFGDSSQAEVKWRAAAAVLADPSVVELDYVDLRVPGRAALGGSGHTLPPPE